MKSQELWRKLHNLEQLVREKVSLRPSTCQCKLCEPDHYFECPNCRYLRPWCFGAADDYPDLCDYCWAEVQKMEHDVEHEITTN